ncbi:DUF3806 domain-containing protein [Psychromicrobium lacuslunae]|uniref:DUF3806 domain-containing protein n=1 Tax=Psychromicrobium lacuslunae TaxID=1618207 RepID=A0A0D4BXD3_9MICC|nr:DUF3806 domain-containing protein [Psychromicrobium lacuslunae]AJT40785.1 hypothetical protein UM93_03310 [Psychromicrobium lacuslunae]
MTQQIAPLSAETSQYLDSMRGWIAGHLPEESRAEFASSGVKLQVLAAMLNNGWVGPENTWELHAMGAVFGDALAQELELEWVQVSDEYGTDPAVRVPGSTVLSFPLTIIAKRVEQQSMGDVYELFGAAMQGILDAAHRADADTGQAGQ